jgi:hypothetical protein
MKDFYFLFFLRRPSADSCHSCIDGYIHGGPSVIAAEMPYLTYRNLHSSTHLILTRIVEIIYVTYVI